MDDFPSPREADVVVSLECVCVSVCDCERVRNQLYKIVDFVFLKLQDVTFCSHHFYFELHCLSNLYQPETTEVLTGSVK